MRCANEIREYVEGNKYLTDQELRKLLSRYLDGQCMVSANVLSTAEIEFIQSMYLDSGSDER
ncbi:MULTISPECIES: hypothetical protein [Alteromonas]|jgi:hypothetical protein|uniref:hypothetical protein n=1 Tax=Alteromonas TaxID=226 RepID=UPI001930DC74|nr:MULTISPECIES: hypothetical protein [Alteromonas]MCG7643650.1 hypothetical protein [Alteromonas sp. MmMcT2-2]MCG7651402.1 hypothetical protein [Alteromonas sp. MmMcT2-5]